MVIGVLVGALAGYFRGWVDTILMRLVDTIMSFPSLFLIISLVAVLGPSIYNIMAILGFLGWPPLARLVRAQILAEREKDYITAARCLGIPDSRILLRHLLPSTASVVVVNATFGIAGAIMSEAGLSFLGLGVQPPNPSWGNMLLQAQSLTVLESMPWLWVPPGIAILITVIAINFIGDGLRDALDPRAIY
jgi:peptide/nickel transport system permease protein